MNIPAAPIDTRGRKEIAAQLRARLGELYPGWPEAGGAGNALLEVFARYAEIVVERINRIPDRNRITFFSELGGELLPPQPASIVLTFSLAPGGTTAAIVPKGTQVAAAPMPGASQPVVFETDADVVITAAKLDSLFSRDPAADRYTDLSALTKSPTDNPLPVFSGSNLLEHTLYIGAISFFGNQVLDRFSISLEIVEALESSNEAIWEIWDGSQAIQLSPDKDGISTPTRTGEVRFRNLPPFAQAEVAAQRMHWLRCRLVKPLSRAVIARTVSLEREIAASDLLPEAAFTNGVAVDLSKDFYPLGTQPRFGDSLYLVNRQAFGLPGAQLTLRVVVTNSIDADGPLPVPRVNASSHASVAWEYSNGQRWIALGTTTVDATVNEDSASGFMDTTCAFTRSGQVSFLVPADIRPMTHAGIHGPWLRARLVANGYGEEAGYTAVEMKPGTMAYAYRPSTVVAPLLNSIAIDYTLHEVARPPDALLACNDFSVADLASALTKVAGEVPLLLPSEEAEPALYLGFDPPFHLAMPSTPINLYFAFEGTRSAVAQPEGPDAARVRWQYWDGASWVQFDVLDQTGDFAFSGCVSFIVPPACRASEEFGRRRYWLRVSCGAAIAGTGTLLRAVLLNTTLGSQALTLVNEVLGSSIGAPDQTFTASRRPVLQGEVLQVRGASRVDSASEPWAVWQEVSDFHASGPLDTHYVLDRLAGVIRFGNGLHGAIPASGTNNVRLARYRTGGGTVGNVASGTVVQLKTTVPYVQSVTNVEPSCGGSDAEPVAAMLERAPRSFRHRSRAVTIEDYEDLALLASPNVARARCIPLANLVADPGAIQKQPGMVSVLIVPRAAGPRPQPKQALLQRVRDYIEAHQSVTAGLIITGPEYVEFEIDVEIGIVSPDVVPRLELSLRQALVDYFHPLSGGSEGKGWDFGRRPQRSDLFSLLSSHPGVDHVRSVSLRQREERPGAAETDHFLVYLGKVNLTFTLLQPIS